MDNIIITKEDRTKRKDVRIVGLPESSNEYSEQTTNAVQSLITEKLGVDNLSVRTTHPRHWI